MFESCIPLIAGTGHISNPFMPTAVSRTANVGTVGMNGLKGCMIRTSLPLPDVKLIPMPDLQEVER